MPGGSTSALALAGRLRELDEPALTALLVARDVQDRRIRDHFDLAESLLDPSAVQRALSRLDRPTLAVLAALVARGARDAAAAAENTGGDAAAALARLEALALVAAGDDRVVAYDAVADQLGTWPSLGLPSPDDLIGTRAPAALERVSDADPRFIDRTAGERAFSTTIAITEFVAELARQPARELAKGGIALPDAKRLAQVMGLDLGDVATLRDVAENAGLVVRESHLWRASAESEAWQEEPALGRWRRLAQSWLDRLPPDIREVLASRAHAVWGEGLEDYLGWFFPAGGEWMRGRIAAVLRDAGALGLSAQGVSSTAGTALLEDGADAAAAALGEAFPAEVDRVYIQNDLTVVAPGPLVPEADARLRRLADIENRALASSYRITRASLGRALASGETAESIRAFLAALSLTGIPQPLEYLITETGDRFGALRVGPRADGRAYLRSHDIAQLDAIGVDQNLTQLSLDRVAPDRFHAQVDPTAVFWNLVEARYSAAMETPEGDLVPVDPVRGRPVERPAGTDTVPLLVERLRLGGGPGADENGAAWLARQLEIAIRGRTTVQVTVTLPDGSTPTYRLEPAALAGGRLRARDRTSDIERTLPLASITAVEPV